MKKLIGYTKIKIAKEVIMMINSTSLNGRLTRDMKLNHTQSGTAVCSFSLAVERNFKDRNGDRGVDYINCVVWQKAAESLAKFTKKGTLIGVTGRLQSRSYEDNTGHTVYATELVVEQFSLLQPKLTNANIPNDEQAASYAQADPEPAYPEYTDYDTPF